MNRGKKTNQLPLALSESTGGSWAPEVQLKLNAGQG